MPHTQTQHESVKAGLHFRAAQATEWDILGFSPYVKAMAHFLSHPKTSLPLTISIEGEWGVGKSSFMKQLDKQLKEKRFATIWFDPWRHVNDESIWATFALECIRQLKGGRFWLYRPWLKRQLFWRRLKFDASVCWRILSWVVELLFIIIWLGIIWFICTVFGPKIWAFLGQIDAISEATGKAMEWSVRLGLAVLALLPVFKEVKSSLTTLLQVDLQRYLQNPRYSEHVGLLSLFHTDFKHILDVYVPKKRVAIFIDDLDRCIPERAVAMMQAIHMMMSEEPRIVFVLGMNHDMIAAGYAVSHERLLPHLALTQVHKEVMPERQSDTESGMEYGISFLEKFVTIPFRVPTSDDYALDRLLDPIPGGHEPAQPIAAAAHVDDAVGLDDEKLKELTRLVAPALAYNPRRINQFQNLLRFHTYILHQTGQLKENLALGRRAVTLEQLAKLIVLRMRWPHLLWRLQASPEEKKSLLEKAYNANGTELVPDLKRWANDRNLMGLLRVGCMTLENEKDEKQILRYGLDNLDLRLLSHIAPPMPASSDTIIKDYVGNSAVGSLAFWKEHRHKLGRIVYANMDAYRRFGRDHPLQLKDEREREIWLYGVSAGHAGDGPDKAVIILEEAGLGKETELREIVEKKVKFELSSPAPIEFFDEFPSKESVD